MAAIASGQPERGAGISASISSETSSLVAPVLDTLLDMMPSRRAVEVAPGRTLLTVMPKGASSLAMVFAQEATAPRMVLLTPRFFRGIFTEVEITFTTLPQFAAFIPGMASVVRM